MVEITMSNNKKYRADFTSEDFPFPTDSIIPAKEIIEVGKIVNGIHRREIIEDTGITFINISNIDSFIDI